MVIRPSSGSTAPAITFMRVDLPAPFSPSSACTSPAETSRFTPESALTPGYDLLTASARRRGTGLLAGAPYLVPVDRRQRNVGIEEICVALPYGAGADIEGLRDVLAAGDHHRELGTEPTPLREAVVRLGDDLALFDAGHRLRCHVVRKYRHLVLLRRRGPPAGVENASALSGDHRSEAHLVRRGPDVVE